MAVAPLLNVDAPVYSGEGVSGDTPIARPAAAPTAPAPAGKTVNVIAPDGKVYGLDEAYLPQAAQQGYQIESADHAGIRSYLEQNRGIGGAAKVALQGLLNEGTFGVAGVLAEKTGDPDEWSPAVRAALGYGTLGLSEVYRNAYGGLSGDPYKLAKFKALQNEHEAANAVGSAAGFAASMLYGGELFQGANAAGKAARAGVLAERALAKGVAAEAAYRVGAEAGAEVAKHSPGIARQIMAHAADYGAQGAVFSAPKAAAQLFTGDPDKAAETWIWGVAGGAALGAAVGGVSAAAGKMWGASAKAAEATALSDEVRVAEEAVAQAEAKHGVAAGSAEVPPEVTAARSKLKSIQDQLESTRSTLAEHYAKLPEYAEAFAQFATGKPNVPLREIAKDFAEEQAVRSLNPFKRFGDKLAEMPGGDRAAGRLLLDNGLLPHTNEAVAEYAGRIGEKVDELGSRIGGFHDALNEAGDVVSVRAIARNMRAAVLDPLRKKIGYSAQANKVEAYINDFERAYDLGRLEGETKKQWLARTKEIKVGVKELHERRIDMDRLLYGEKVAMTADKVDKEYKAIRNMYSMALDNGYQSAGKKLGWSAQEIGAIKQLNREFGAFKVIHGAVEANIGREIANRGFGSMTDMLAGIAGSAGGALLGPVGSAAGGMVASYVNNQLRKNANHWLAELADIYAKTGNIPDVARRAYAQVGGALLPGKWGAAAASVAGMADSAVAQAGAALDAAAARVTDPITAAAGKVAESNAATAGAIRDATARMESVAERILAQQKTKTGGMAALEAAFAKHGELLGRIPSMLDGMAAGKTAARDTLGVNILTRFLEAHDSKLDDHRGVMDFANRMAALASNPDKMQAKIEAAVAPLQGDAPEVAMAVGTKLGTVANYLASQAPKSPYAVPTPFVKTPEWKPTDAQIKDYKTKVQVALNPYAAITALGDNTLTKAHIDALRAVAPKLYEEMIRRIADHAASGQAKPLPYAQRLKLSMMTGAPLDRSIQHLAGLQGIYKTAEASKVEGGGKPIGAKNPALQQSDVSRISG